MPKASKDTWIEIFDKIFNLFFLWFKILNSKFGNLFVGIKASRKNYAPFMHHKIADNKWKKMEDSELIIGLNLLKC